MLKEALQPEVEIQTKEGIHSPHPQKIINKKTSSEWTTVLNS